MNDLTILRHAALELRALDSKEVVKVAGVVRRLKNWIKKIIDPEYKDKVNKFQDNAKSLQNLADQLENSLKELQSAIKDGEVAAYNKNYQTVLQLSEKFYNALKDLGEDGQNVAQIMATYTKKDMKSPGFAERFKKVLPPGYNIEIGKIYNKKIKEMAWFKNISPELIYIREGQNVSALSKLVAGTKARIVDDHSASPEKAEELLSGENLKAFLMAWRQAIVDGTLVVVNYFNPSKQITRAEGGLTELQVTSAPFSIPGTDIRLQVEALLIDKRSALGAMEKLSLKATKRVTILNSKKSEFKSIIKKIGLAQEVPYKLTTLSELQLAEVLREGYKKTFGQDPSAEVLASGWAQVALENARGEKIYNNNFGNLKATEQWVQSGKPFAVKSTGEYDSKGKYYTHADAKWQVYRTPVEGAAAYWSLLGRKYKTALSWMAAGNPENASQALSKANYYTADVDKYSSGMKSLYRHFMEKLSTQLPGLQSAPQQSNFEMTSPSTNSELQDIDSLITSLYSSAEGPVGSFVKQALLVQALPISKVKLIVKSNDFSNTVSYCQTLNKLAKEYLNADVKISQLADGAEMICSMTGKAQTVLNATRALSECIKLGMENYRPNADIKIQCLEA